MIITPRRDALLLEQLPQQALGRLGVAAALNQDVEHDPVLVHGAPEPMLLAGDADHDLVEVPLVAWCRETAADLVGKALAELQRPLPHRLMADQDAAGGAASPRPCRRLRGNRKYNQTAWLITSAGKRWRA